MPKLWIQIDHEFEAGPFNAYDMKKGSSAPLNAKRMRCSHFRFKRNLKWTREALGFF